MLENIGSEKSCVNEVLEALDQTIRNDLAAEVSGAAQDIMTDRIRTATVKEQADALTQERESINALGALLIDSPVGRAAEVARSFLEPKGLLTSTVEAAVQRFEAFRRMGRITPKAVPATR